jgi:hypothetical protein
MPMMGNKAAVSHKKRASVNEAKKQAARQIEDRAACSVRTTKRLPPTVYHAELRFSSRTAVHGCNGTTVYGASRPGFFAPEWHTDCTHKRGEEVRRRFLSKNKEYVRIAITILDHVEVSGYIPVSRFLRDCPA